MWKRSAARKAKTRPSIVGVSWIALAVHSVSGKISHISSVTPFQYSRGHLVRSSLNAVHISLLQEPTSHVSRHTGNGPSEFSLHRGNSRAQK
jgi:hypothetical protein